MSEGTARGQRRPDTRSAEPDRMGRAAARPLCGYRPRSIVPLPRQNMLLVSAYRAYDLGTLNSRPRCLDNPTYLRLRGAGWGTRALVTVRGVHTKRAEARGGVVLSSRSVVFVSAAPLCVSALRLGSVRLPESALSADPYGASASTIRRRAI